MESALLRGRVGSSGDGNTKGLSVRGWRSRMRLAWALSGTRRGPVAGAYRRKVARLATALGKPEERDAAAAAIRGLIDGIVLTPGEKRGELQVTLRGELGKILEWTGSGAEKEKTDTPVSGMSVSVVAGAGFEPATFRL